MEVILQQDYPSLGYVGDTVRVRPGYARNFLLPRGIALEAFTTNANLLKHRMAAVNAKKAKLRGQAEEFATKIQTVKLEFTLRVGSGGRTFGSISSKEIEVALKKEGVELDRRQIKLLEPLRKLGEHKVSVKLHSEVTATLPVTIHGDMPEKTETRKESSASGEVESVDGAAAGKRKGKRSKKAPSAVESESVEKTADESGAPE